jgi:hypothetical protein
MTPLKGSFEYLRCSRVCRFKFMLHLTIRTKLSIVALVVLSFAGLLLPSSSAYVGVSVTIAPPAIPVYEQPPCPVEGYIWTPGYWAYADFGYYWVPGVWVAPPDVGLLWTPGYWAYSSGRYVFYDGYWGPTVGFYGGIDYGFGYAGHGYYGGQWVGNTFRYNTAVTRVNNTVVHNTYVNKEAVTNGTGSRASFNGPGGVQAKPTAQEQASAKAEHVPPTSAQRARVEEAKNDPALHATNNHGKPKPEAIRTFDRNNGQRAAAMASGGTKKQGVADERAGAQKAENQTPHVAHPGTEVSQTQKTSMAPNGKHVKPSGGVHPNSKVKGSQSTTPGEPSKKKKKPTKQAPSREL